MTRIVLVGAAGRMGAAIAAAANGSGVEIAARVDHREFIPGDSPGWSEEVPAALPPGTVVVEFSSPAGAAAAARACAAQGVPLVSGSTGLGPDDEGAIAAAARKVAVLRASNFSIGVAALRRALAAALAAVPRSWDVEIVERHHRLKKDSPSGTAATLAGDVLAERGLPPGAVRCGRQGAVGARPAAEVGVHSVRGGTWVGDHTVLLAGEGEWIELRHIAQDRAAFAHGALAAARFVENARPGMYRIEDLLA